MIRATARILCCFLLASLLSSCYVFRQAYPFLTHHLCARSNEKILKDERTDAETIALLTRVGDIRAFARDELGLDETENYTKLYDLDADYLAAVVQAAPEFSSEPYLFTYPVLGKLPYKGFYNTNHARREAEKLKAKGLDVFVRPVDAFSSLGYFRDPLYSFMADYSPASLAELIIHEQTHATIFIKGESDFNEKLATVVGREGARQYVISRFGESSDEYQKLIDSRNDAEQFTRDMFDLGKRLSAIYAQDIPVDTKRRQKSETIEKFKREFGDLYEERYTGDGYRGAANINLNNAYLSLFRLYEEPDGRIQQLLEKTGGIGPMIKRLKDELEKSKAAPWEIVEVLLID